MPKLIVGHDWRRKEHDERIEAMALCGYRWGWRELQKRVPKVPQVLPGAGMWLAPIISTQSYVHRRTELYHGKLFAISYLLYREE